MCDLGKALEETGYFPFLCAGVKVGEDMMPMLRVAGEVGMVRKLPDEAWRILRDSLVQSIDSLHEAPLDDLSGYSYGA